MFSANLLQVSRFCLCLLILGISPAYPQIPRTTTPTLVAGDEQILDLAIWVVKQAPMIHCRPGACKILVTNFRVPDGVNPLFGVQLADELSAQLAASQKQFSLFSRNLLKSYLEASYTDPKSVKNDQELSLFAGGLGANAVVAAEVVRVQGDSFRLLVRFLNAKEKDVLVTTEIVIMRSPPAVPPQNAQVAKSTINLPQLTPSCFYMPNPPYSNKAREAKFEGVVLVDAVVYPDGSVGDFRILKSPGLDLDDMVRKTMNEWKCRPATVEGKPVPTRVQFQLNFRLLRN
jgi:TonB family protein